MGDGDVAKARRLLDEAGLEELSLEAVAGCGRCWLTTRLGYTGGGHPAAHQQPGSRDGRSGQLCHVVRSDQAYLLLHSDRRTDAILLEALIAGDPAKRSDPQGGQWPVGPPHARDAGTTPRRTSLSCWPWIATLHL
jgi:hypothetical protein